MQKYENTIYVTLYIWININQRKLYQNNDIFINNQQLYRYFSFSQHMFKYLSFHAPVTYSSSI